MVEPLSLKARSGPGGGEASVAGGYSMALSRAWAVKKTQRGIYTGGKVRSMTRAGNSRRSLATYFPPSSILSTPNRWPCSSPHHH
jgi:hypothetical protein